MQATRYDFLGTTQGCERTAQGFLRARAHLTRTGIFTYQSGEKKIRELRTDSEVFHPSSLASIKSAPITDLHPSERGADSFVSPANAKDLSVGFVEEAHQDGTFVAATLLITDAQAIAAVESGARKEISLGYSCEVDPSSGVHNGESYDAVQKNIVINHVALGPSGWGRAGPQCAIKLDSQLAIHIKEDAIVAEEKDSALELLSAELTEKKDALEKLSGRLDTLTQELEKERRLRMDAEDPEVVEGKVKSRLSLLNQCQKFLSAEEIEGKSDRQLKEAVISKESPLAQLAEKDAPYVDGMFEAIVCLKEQRNDALGLAHVAASSTTRLDADAIRFKQAEHAQHLWQKPLAGSL